MRIVTIIPMTLGRDKLPAGAELEMTEYSGQKLIDRGLAKAAPKPKKAKKPAKE